MASYLSTVYYAPAIYSYVDICSAVTVRVLLVVIRLLQISTVNGFSLDTVYTCKYCWQQVRRCDYENHIGRSCPDLPVHRILECGDYIPREVMNFR